MPLRDARAFEPAIDVGIVRRPDDDAAGDAVIARAERHDLPIGEMARDEKDALAAGDGGIERVEPEDFDARIGPVHVQLVEMRVLGHHAPEIVPHRAHDGGDLGRRFLRERGLEILGGEARHRRRRDQGCGRSSRRWPMPYRCRTGGRIRSPRRNRRFRDSTATASISGMASARERCGLRRNVLIHLFAHARALASLSSMMPRFGSSAKTA